jgi:hypothetical protein
MTVRPIPLLTLLALLALAWFLFAPSVQAQGVWPSECFPVEKLPAALRPQAEETLLKLLDSEALYTVVGGLKPMSGGYVSLSVSVEKPDTARLDALRQVLGALRCGDRVRADLLTFGAIREGKRYAEGVVFSRAGMERTLSDHAAFFAPYGLTRASAGEPISVALSIEREPTTARNRGLGYLYGYPDPAVTFFVQGQDEFKEIAGRILAEYKKRRARFVGPGKPGVVALLREWFQGPDGLCTPENARF